MIYMDISIDIETIVTEAEYGVPLPLEEVGVLVSTKLHSD